jgi:hypothetical protein
MVSSGIEDTCTSDMMIYVKTLKITGPTDSLQTSTIIIYTVNNRYKEFSLEHLED